MTAELMPRGGPVNKFMLKPIGDRQDLGVPVMKPLCGIDLVRYTIRLCRSGYREGRDFVVLTAAWRSRAWQQVVPGCW